MTRRPFTSRPKAAKLESTTALASVTAVPSSTTSPGVAKMVDAAAPARKVEPTVDRRIAKSVPPQVTPPERKAPAKPSGDVAPMAKADAKPSRSPAKPESPTIVAGKASRDKVTAGTAQATTPPATIPAAVTTAGRQTVEGVQHRAAESARSAADQVSTQTQAAGAAVAGAAHGMKDGASTLAELNAKVAEAMRSNIEATFSFWTSLLGAGSISRFAALNTEHMRHQLDAFTLQSRELTGLAQKLAADTLRGMTGRGIDKPR